MTTTPTKSMVGFLVLLFVLSVPLWLAGPIFEQLLHQDVPLNLPLSALQFVIPLIAALVMTYREDSPDQMKRLLQRPLDFKRIYRKIWYLPAFLLMPLILIVAWNIMQLWGNSISDPQVPIVWAPVFFMLFFVSGACEEIGWQGFAYDRLEKQWSALKIGVIWGAIWAIWHTIPHIQQGYAMTWIVWQSIFSIGLRILIIWVYNNTGKSISAASTFHAMSNVSVYLFPNYGSYYDPGAAAIAIMAIVALVIAIWGPKTLIRPSNFAEAKRSSKSHRSGLSG